MRIWDVSPGYLNRQSLLGEHRELHGIVSIIVNNKKGYSNHPETLRWVGYGWALKMRHDLLASEMQLRGYAEKTPVRMRSKLNHWPNDFIDHPVIQYGLLKDKYRDKPTGRIPLPKNVQQLWSHHKYSILARSETLYRNIGGRVANKQVSMDSLSMQLCEALRTDPGHEGIRNALQHMWGHVSGQYPGDKTNVNKWSLRRLLKEIQILALDTNETYLCQSTALSELMVWIAK